MYTLGNEFKFYQGRGEMGKSVHHDIDRGTVGQTHKHTNTQHVLRLSPRLVLRQSIIIPQSVNTPASWGRRKVYARVENPRLEAPFLRLEVTEFVIPPHFCNRRYRASGLVAACRLVIFCQLWSQRPGGIGRRKLEPTATPHEHQPCGCPGDATDHTAAPQQLA